MNERPNKNEIYKTAEKKSNFSRRTTSKGNEGKCTELRNNTAVRIDGILTEFYKNGGGKVAKKLRALIK